MAKKKTSRKTAKKKKRVAAKSPRKKAAKKKVAGKKTKKKVARKKAKKATKRRKTAVKKTTKKKKRKPNAAFMRPLDLSDELAAVVGRGPMSRPQVTKKLWAYIKRRGLQDSENRRTINADDKLRAVFGGKRKVDMFKMTALVSQHLS